MRVRYRVVRQAGDGVWNNVAGARNVVDDVQQVIGYKRTFIFELNGAQTELNIPLGR